MLEF
jgi:hypothetical protein